MDPALALPSYRVYRGSLVALLIGSIFAIWLLVLPQAGADRDAPPSSLAGVLPTRTVGTVPTPTASPAVTPTATPTSPPAEGTATPQATPTASATPAPTATTSGTAPVDYTVQPGDTLYAIAERFLPAGRDLDQFMQSIQSLNNITDPAALQVGNVIKVPRQ